MTIQIDLSDGVMRVELNRPETLNAWNRQLGLDLHAALDDAATRDDVRAVLITGAGRAFSTGADLKAGDAGTTADGHPDLGGILRELYNPLIVAIRELPKPVIAAVNGPAVGIGCSLALSADLLLAAESAYFLLGFGRIGLSLDGGASAFLAARVGHARAHELAIAGGRLSARQALDWGLVNAVHPDAEFMPAAEDYARTIAAGAPRSAASAKRLLNAALYPHLREQLELEAELQQEHATTNDFVEGVLAMIGKRTPQFTGS